MVDRYGALVLATAGLLATVPPVVAAPAAPPSAARQAPAPARAPAPPPTPQSPTGRDAAATVPPAPSVSPDAAARARMHECGHQWSALKKAGNVGTMTWKDFSATCLVVSK